MLVRLQHPKIFFVLCLFVGFLLAMTSRISDGCKDRPGRRPICLQSNVRQKRRVWHIQTHTAIFWSVFQFIGTGDLLGSGGHQLSGQVDLTALEKMRADRKTALEGRQSMSMPSRCTA